MPSMRPSADKWKNARLVHAVEHGMLLTMHCPYCRRTAHFWAKDLIQVLGPDHEMHRPPFSCSKCKTPDIRVSWRIPAAAELQGLLVRRPVRKIERWIWRDEPA